MNVALMHSRRAAFWMGALVAIGTSGVAQSQDFTPVFKPTLQVSRTHGKIAVDGNIDDAGWSAAARTNHFHEREPGDNIKPDVATEVLVTYDDDKFYVAFICHDDPNSVRATMSQRDQWQGNDDVRLLLDTYGDGAWAYSLSVNPYGIQRDAMWTGQGEGGAGGGFDLIWESAARKTDSGYSVEIALPFASLRFPDKDVQRWRAEFFRDRPREVYKQYSWGANDRSDQCFPCKWGTIEGIAGVHSGKGLEILPAMVAHQTGSLSSLSDPNAPFDNENPKGELSIGSKYAASSDLTIEAAVNPDFSQIEADAGQIEANSTISLFYPERRPFFQEGSDIFETLFNSFYTRTINDPSFTAKLTSRHGKTRIGVTSAYDENSPYMIPLDASNYTLNGHKSLVNVVRGSRQFGDNSQIGFMMSDRRYDGGGSGSIASIDGSFRLSRTYRFRGQYIMSHTAEPTFGSTFGGRRFDLDKHTAALDGEKYWGDAFITRLDRGTRHLFVFAGYNQIAPTYRTQTGYDPVANHRTAELFGGLTIRPKKGPIVTINPQVYYSRRWDFKTGVCRFDQMNASVDINTSIAQTYIGIQYYDYYERWRGAPFDGLSTVSFNVNSRPSDKVGVAGYLNGGKGLARFAAARANTVSYGLSLNIKPVDRITVEPSLDYSRMTRLSDGDRYFSGYITRTRVQFQGTKALSVRLVVQYDDFSKNWDIDPLMTYRLSPFSVLYLGSTMDYGEVSTQPEEPTDPIQTKWRTTHRQVFMKLQYLFQV